MGVSVLRQAPYARFESLNGGSLAKSSLTFPKRKVVSVESGRSALERAKWGSSFLGLIEYPEQRPAKVYARVVIADCQ